MFAATSKSQLSSHQHREVFCFRGPQKWKLLGRRSVLNGGWGKAFPVDFQEGVDGIL